MIIGYARVSTEDQNLDAQITALTEAGAERIFAEKISGTKRTRPELDRMLDQLRPGDVVLVAKYDRLARSLVDLLEIVAQIETAQAGFKSVAEDIDTTTPAGNRRRNDSNSSGSRKNRVIEISRSLNRSSTASGVLRRYVAYSSLVGIPKANMRRAIRRDTVVCAYSRKSIRVRACTILNTSEFV